MKLRTCKYYIKESFKGFYRNRFMSLASITSVTATLLVIGIFLLLALNFDYIATNIESQVEIKVFLIDDISAETVKLMKDNIMSVTGVKEVLYESKDDALKNFQSKYKKNSNLLEGLKERNPLPASFTVRLESANYARSVSDSVLKMQNVENVVYGKEVLDKLLKVTYALRVGCLILIVILFLISTFIISNTIKLTVFARRREISIMKFVGATDWFVRWPFIIEGFIIGIIGSIITVIALGALYTYCLSAVSKTMIGIMSFSIMPFAQIMLDLSLFIIAIGSFIGILGSLLSVRRFLKV